MTRFEKKLIKLLDEVADARSRRSQADPTGRTPILSMTGDDILSYLRFKEREEQSSNRPI